MGLLDGLFGSSQQTTVQRPQVLEGLEGLVPQLAGRATAAGSRPYAKRNFARLAPMSGSTRAGINMTRGVAADPRYGQRFGMAEGMIGSSTDDANQQALIRSLSRSIRPERSGAGAWTDPGTASAYMNPYQEQVLDRLLRREDEGTAQGRAEIDRRLAGKQAFGSGSDIANAQFERDAGNRRADLVADTLSKGYESGARTFATDADRAAATGRANADRALQAQDLMTRGIGMGATAEGSRLAGRRAAGNDMASLADRYRTGLNENARNLLGIGNIEQQDLQRGMDLQEKDFEEQRDFPEDRANFLARTVYGAPRGATTTTPGPSTASQLLGGALSIAGIGGPSGFGWWGLKRGGAVRMAGGGDPLGDLSDNELRNAATNPMLPPDMRTRAQRLLQARRDAPRAPAGFDALPLPPPGPGGDAPEPTPESLPPLPLGPGGDTPDFPMPPAPAPTLRKGTDGVFALDPSDADLPLPPPGPAAFGGDRGAPGAGADDTAGGDEAPGNDRYAQILERLLKADEPDKGRLLMHIGAAMMAGQKPGFLANVGEGLAAGAKAMDADQARRVRALGTAATVEERRQTNKERSEDRKARIAEAADKLKESQRQFNEGKIGEKELRAAQAEYYRARAEAEKTGKDRSTANERMIVKLMEDDPTLTRREAMGIVNGTTDRRAIADARQSTENEKRRDRFILEATTGYTRPLSKEQQAEEIRRFGPRPDRSGDASAAAPPPAAGAPKAGDTKEPPRPQGLAPKAQWSPSQRAWWWQDQAGVWQSRKAE